jgi:hypothetical protein
MSIMKKTVSISRELQAIIPKFQLKAIMKSVEEHKKAINRLEKRLKKIPYYDETREFDVLAPVIFHYFDCTSDYYICEYDPEDGIMFGFILDNDDLDSSDWAVIYVPYLLEPICMNIDFYFKEQDVIAAVNKKYPDFNFPALSNLSPIRR